ncbi:MAG: Bifunctional protein HldE [Verrucomicrobia subdivision 3 bacterium]|nr:Bifunctional protein HldE [Limisphaerales bacterium]MCS1415654.1 Bifunctional protein HldE [Limisphaerales bacterium]
MPALTRQRVKQILEAGAESSILVIGDVMLDCFISGDVSRISPEAPVPILRFQSESFMPGGAANVARNLTALGAPTSLLSITGRDPAGKQLKSLLEKERVNCRGIRTSTQRHTGTKTRIVTQQQQIVRVDREVIRDLNAAEQTLLKKQIQESLPKASAVILGDYGKGVATDSLIAYVKKECCKRSIWLSLDPKPVHAIDLSGLSLITPNRKEAFELAGVVDSTQHSNPLEDENLRLVSTRLLRCFSPTVLLITLGDLGMLLCQRGKTPVHIPTVTQEVFDVSGAGDTVIASFTLAIAAGASPVEASIFSNHAGGIVVGKKGTATVSKKEIIASFRN